MRQRLITLLLILFTNILLVSNTHASHLMGGNLGYESLGYDASSGMYRYVIILQNYIYCGPGSNWQYPEPTMTVSIYDHSTLVEYTSMVIAIVDTIDALPSLPDSCTKGINICIRQGLYIDTVSLPFSISGYDVFLQRCCRNAAIINLNNPGGQGLAYYTFIPPSVILNTSPVFLDLPVPYICAGDTNSIINTAYDADGDQLVFSFATPYRGTGFGNPNPLNWPINPVTYAAAHDSASPFGPGGYASINSITGQTEYYTIDTGLYVVAVEIKEFRTGFANPISVTRRDLQLIVITCPANPAPNLSNSGGSGQKTWFITEGDSLCFPIIFTDANGDSLYTTSVGFIFDTAFVNPAATINTPMVGDSIVNLQFCWNTTCGQASPIPYLFNVFAIDNGCPPKSSNLTFSIYVDTFRGPPTINGPKVVCATDTGVAYDVVGSSGSIFQWSIMGGVITSGTGTDTITVDWSDTTSVGTLTLLETSVYGCVGDTLATTIFINTLPIIGSSAVPDSICPADSALLIATGGLIYAWTLLSDFSDTLKMGDSVYLPTDTTVLFVVHATDTNGCLMNDTIQLTTFVLPNIQINASADSICPYDSSTLIAIGGTSYWWNQVIKPNDTISLTNSVMVTSDTTDTLNQYVVIGTDGNGCVNTDTFTLTINPVPDSTIIWGSPNICPGAKGIDYYILDSLNSTYQWSALGATILSGQGTDSILVDWDSTGNWVVKVLETNQFGCISDSSYFPVLINVFYTPVKPLGADTVCSDDKLGQAYQAIYTNGSNYYWHISGGTIVSGDSTFSVVVDWNILGQGFIWYEEENITNDTVCFNPSDTLWLELYPSPPVKTIMGDFAVCEFDSLVTYTVADTANSLYEWTIQSGVIVSGDSTNTITVNWDTAGTYTLAVIETNIYGCQSDTMKVLITVYMKPIPTALNGDLIICAPDSTSITYWVDGGTVGSTFIWMVNGGVIINGAGTDTVQIDWNLSDNGTIQVVEQTADSCFSDTLSLSIIIDDPVIEIKVVSDKFEKDDDIRLKWSMTKDTVLNNIYHIYRRQKDSSWVYLDSTQLNEYEDKGLATSMTSSDYRIVGINACGDSVTSEPHNSIFLEGVAFEDLKDVEISWNEYVNWPLGVDYYEVWRKLDQETEFTFYRSALSDTFDSYQNGRDGYTHCYKIVAYELGDTTRSWSNEMCLEFKHTLIIPSAFSPNQDGVNDRWVIKNLDFHPGSTVELFNRWGNLVYYAKNYKNDFDGTRDSIDPISKGLPDGTYFYLIKLKPTDNTEATTFKGTVTIFR